MRQNDGWLDIVAEQYSDQCHIVLNCGHKYDTSMTQLQYNMRRLRWGYDFTTSSLQHPTSLYEESKKLARQFFVVATALATSTTANPMS